ncbi:MAG: hypothetical protein HKN36_12750 [Hellea sp.]|nr:hypothetical protein [Hellea sp.]
MTYAWPDFVGTIGIVLILYAYFALQTERLTAKHLSYNILNFGGALLILFSLLFKFNWSAFIIELAWAGISLYGIFKNKREPL